jgi:hypothetical protein
LFVGTTLDIVRELRLSGRNLSLFGGMSQPISIELTVFCDERKMVLTKSEEWWYICIIMIPSHSVNDVISTLRLSQEEHGYTHEMSFADIKGSARRSPKTAVAREWLRLLKAGTGKTVYWKILGIATHNLDFSSFGPGHDSKGKYANVYNRFFRAAFLYCTNTYFGNYERIIITDIFHDTEGNLQHHQYFNWHLPRVVQNKRIHFRNNRIRFIVSDHQKEKTYKPQSYLIQLADILVGSVSQLLDESSGRSGKIELGDCMSEMLRTAPSSPWQAAKDGYSVSFFPKKRVSLKGLDQALRPSSDEFFARYPKVTDQGVLL